MDNRNSDHKNRQVNSTAGISNSGPTHIWDPPVALPSDIEPAPTLDESLTPEPIRDWVIDECRRSGVPLEMIAIPFISSLAIAVGGKLGMYPRQYDTGWLVKASCLWCAVIARNGSKKTHSISAALSHLRKIESEEFQKYSSQMKASGHRIKVLQQKLEAIQGELSSVDSEGERERILNQQHVDLQDQLDTLNRPPRRLITEDATIPKLSELLRDNPQGLGVIFDELMSWISMFDKKNFEDSRPFYLKAWDGKQPNVTDRISRGLTYVEAVYLVVIGGIQPPILAPYISRVLASDRWDDGLIQRMQMAIIPDTSKIVGGEDRVPNAEAARRVSNIVTHLYYFEHPVLQSFLDDCSSPALHFSAEAQTVFNEFLSSLEEELKSSPPALEGHISKNRSMVPALALIFHLMDIVSDRSQEHVVSVDALNLAIAWREYLLEHAKRMYGIGSNGSSQAAREIVAKIRSGHIRDTMTVRDIHRKQWAKLTDVRDIRDGLNYLEDLGWVCLHSANPGFKGGRRSEVVRLNPYLGNRTDKTDETKEVGDSV